MDQDTYTTIFHVPQVPDPDCTAYRALADGNVTGAIGRAFEHLLGSLADMPPDTCAAELLYQFHPQGDGRDRQTRLALYVRLCGPDAGIARNVERLVRAGPLSHYYEFLPVEAVPDMTGLAAHCEIVRPVSFVTPLYSSEFNPGIPDYYCTHRPLVANRENNGMMLDRVLDCLQESAAITIRVQPTDITELRQAHARYLARLEGINRRWNDDEEDLDLFDDVRSDGRRSLTWQNSPKALNLKDQLAYDVQRNEREIHQSLFKRHLSFSIRVAAQTPPVARLLASVVGGCAFEEGCYEVVDEDDGNPSDDGSGSSRPIAESPSAPGRRAGWDMAWKDYEQLRPLRRSACVEELAGIFRLPIGSSCSPCCVRKNTDPPPIESDNLLVLGYDMEGGGGGSPSCLAQPRGLTYEQLRKHMFISGMSGQGKTTAIMGMLIQLHGGSLGRPGMKES